MSFTNNNTIPTIKPPSTPPHPEADQEIQLNNTHIPDDLQSALALDDEDDDEYDGDADAIDEDLDDLIDVTPIISNGNKLNLHRLSNDDPLDTDDEPFMTESDLINVGDKDHDHVLQKGSINNLSPSSTNITSPSALSSTTTTTTTTTDQRQHTFDNFFDIDSHRRAPLNPFGENRNLVSSNPIRIIRRKPITDETNITNGTGTQQQTNNNNNRRLSLNQQSRLVNYIDEKLLSIQRKFIKYLSSRPDENDYGNTIEHSTDKDNDIDLDIDTDSDTNITSNINNVSSSFLKELLSDLKDTIVMIWYSIFKQKEIPVINHSNLFNESEIKTEIELDQTSSDLLFGQTNYLIKIMGDLVDYLDKYTLHDFTELKDILVLFAKLDNIICVLIDDYHDDDDDVVDDVDDTEVEVESGTGWRGSTLINTTEKVRIESIINRTKILMIGKFDQFKDTLKRSHDFDQLVTFYELAIGEIYEGIVDRTSI